MRGFVVVAPARTRTHAEVICVKATRALCRSAKNTCPARARAPLSQTQVSSERDCASLSRRRPPKKTTRSIAGSNAPAVPARPLGRVSPYGSNTRT